MFINAYGETAVEQKRKHRIGAGIHRLPDILCYIKTCAASGPLPLVNLFLETLLALLLLRVLIGLIKYAKLSLLSFDGGINLNTAASFIEGHGYGLFYERFYPFPIETNGPFIFLSSLAMKLGGISPLSTQASNLCFLVAFAVVLYRSLRYIIPRAGALAAVLLIIATPGLIPYGMDGYGEIPALAFFFGALMFLALAAEQHVSTRINLLCGGIMLGLSFVTKIVALVWIAPTIIISVIILRQPRLLTNLCWLSIGVVMPILCWEIFRFFELGGLINFLDWWKFEYGLIVGEAGAREQVISLSKIAIHLDILARETSLGRAQLAIFLLCPYPIIVGLIVSLLRKRNFAGILVVCCVASAAALYFVWWLSITPTKVAWPRRIVNGLVLQQSLITISVVVLVRWFSLASLHVYAGMANRKVDRAPADRGHFMILAAASVATCIILIAPEGTLLRMRNLVIRPPQSASIADFFRMVNIVRQLPSDAVIFTTGWWQAPVLALFTQRKFRNYEWWTAREVNSELHKYLVFDQTARALDPAPFEEILAASSFRTIIDSKAGAIYEITQALPYPPFLNSDRTAPDLRSSVDFRIADYKYVRGMQEWEGTFRWSRPDSAILLRRKDENSLVLTISILPVEMLQGNVLRFDVASPGCIDSEFVVQSGADQRIQLPLNCAGFDKSLPFEVKMHLNARRSFPESMRGDLRLLSFVVHSVAVKHVNHEP